MCRIDNTGVTGWIINISYCHLLSKMNTQVFRTISRLPPRICEFIYINAVTKCFFSLFWLLLLFNFSLIVRIWIKCENFGFSVNRCYGTALSEQYDGPSVKTSIPGPKSQSLLKELNALQVSSSYIYAFICVSKILTLSTFWEFQFWHCQLLQWCVLLYACVFMSTVYSIFSKW